MADLLELAVIGGVIGIAGSAAIDLWSLVLRRGFHIPTLDYALLGRWIGHFKHGRFAHPKIAAASPVAGERALGWVAHYAIGVAFAFTLLVIWGTDWAQSPTILPPMLVGIGSVVAPWFVMQPAFGAGIAGSRTPHPWHGRLRNLGTHVVFGFGLYASALVVAAF